MTADLPSASPFPTGERRNETGVPTAVSPGRGAVTILLVEDNRSDVLIIREILKHEGIKADIHLAGDGEQAIKFLGEVQRNPERVCPDLILLDLNLPRVSGLQVLSHIRTRSVCAETPVVVVTSSRSPEDLAAIQKLNASAYFQKSSDLPTFMQLGKLIRRLLPERI